MSNSSEIFGGGNIEEMPSEWRYTIFTHFTSNLNVIKTWAWTHYSGAYYYTAGISAYVGNGTRIVFIGSSSGSETSRI